MKFLEDIDRFSNDFKNILVIIKEIETNKKQIVENLTHLKIQYTDMVKNNTKKIFFLSLDSFFYQYKIFSAELEQIESSRKIVNNRMYCEYYKLFRIISAYLDDIKLNYENKRAFLKICPIYKDLETTLEYDISDIENIYSNIVVLITYLNDQTLKNMVEIKRYDFNSGFSISNFINTLRNENLILQGQIDLFMNYLSFFLASQQKQHSRIYERITNFLCEFQEQSVIENVFTDHVVIEEPITEPVIVPIEEKKDSQRLDMAFE